MSKGKIIALNWETISSADTEITVCLTQGHIVAIASLLEFLRWQTRWQSPPSADTLQAYVDNFESRLLTDCGDNVTCLDVADCIENNEVVQELIDNRIFLEVTGATATYERLLEKLREEFGVQVEPIAPPLEDCRDYLFSGVIAVLDRLNANNIDFFQLLEIDTNFFELVNEFADVLPPIIAITEIAELSNAYLTWLQETLLENYEAQWTEGLREDLACELLCYFYSDSTCSAVSLDGLFNFFADKVTSYFDRTLGETVFGFIQTLIAGNYTGLVDFVSLTMCVQLGMLRLADIPLARVFLGRNDNVRRLMNALAIGMQASDDTWGILCEPCYTPSPEIFITFDNPALYTIVYGSVVTDAGNPPPSLINATRVLEGGIYIWRATIDIVSPILCNRVDINFFFNRTSGGAIAYTLTDSNNVIYETVANPVQNTWVTTTIELTSPVTITRVELRMGSAGAGTVASVRMDNVRIYTE